MEAIILAGGFGTRLKSVVPNLPKPMAPVNGTPFLAHLLDLLAQQGFNKIYLSVYHQYSIIQDYFGDYYNGLSLIYIIDPAPLGTGGAIAHALSTVTTDKIFVLNGDTYAHLNYHAMYQKLFTLLTIAVHYEQNCQAFGRVEINSDYIVNFAEKHTAEAGYINAGVYLLNTKIKELLPQEKVFSFERDFLMPTIATIQPHVFKEVEYFRDIGVPESYQRFCADQAAARIRCSDHL